MPTYSSWINQVDRFFAYVTSDLLQRSDHRNVQTLEADIRNWIKNWNTDPQPFNWTKTGGAGEQVIVVHHGTGGPAKVARHDRARPGSPAIDDAHFPDHKSKIPSDYTPVPRSNAEAEFLAIGPGPGPGCSNPPRPGWRG